MVRFYISLRATLVESLTLRPKYDFVVTIVNVNSTYAPGRYWPCLIRGFFPIS